MAFSVIADDKEGLVVGKVLPILFQVAPQVFPVSLFEVEVLFTLRGHAVSGRHELIDVGVLVNLGR